MDERFRGLDYEQVLDETRRLALREGVDPELAVEEAKRIWAEIQAGMPFEVWIAERIVLGLDKEDRGEGGP